MSTLSLRAKLGLRTACSVVLASTLVVGLGLASVRAQTVELPEISVYANQAPTDVGKVGAAVTVLRGADLRAQGYNNVPDALRTVPGVEVNQTGGRGSLTQVSIRGSQAKHVLVLIDGVQVNDLQDGAFDFADFSLEGIERIEIVRGPQSGIHGSDANAGVIAITTISGRGQKPSADVKIEGGMERSREIAASARGSSGPFYASVSADREATAGYNISRFDDFDNWSRRTNFNARVGVDFTPDLNVDASMRYVKRITSIDIQPFFGPFVGFAVPSTLACTATPKLCPFPAGDDFTGFHSLQGRVQGAWTTFDGVLVQKLGASSYRDGIDSFDALFGLFQTHGTRDAYDYKGTINVPQSFFGEHQTLTIAADRQRETLVENPSPFLSVPVRVRKGIGGEYTIDLPSALTLTAALRRENNTGFGYVTTWRTSASQKLFSDTRLHGSVGTGVTRPALIDQLGFFPGFFIGNPQLRPESSFGWDAGWEQTWFGGEVVTDVTYFNVRFTDKIITVGVPSLPGTTTETNAPGVSPRQGVEATVKINPVSWVTIAASYTHTDARLSDGTAEIRQPKDKGSINITTHWLDNKLHVTTGIVLHSDMPDLFFGTFPFPTVTLPPYTVVNASISYDVWPGAQIYARVQNLFNTSYEEVFSFRAQPFIAYAGLRVHLSP
ncbi:MAG TPA: TonB-dependent receptor [Xanthobacteraceae bacterium]